MAHVEQAVFTSAETNRSAGYQVVARSPGISAEDARQLAIWGPSHDSLLELGPDAVSFNFHPLHSGVYCVSRTTPAGWEYSGRGGHRIYTQCLVVPPELLRRFANNPFSLIRAAVAGGLFQVHDEFPAWLEPLELVGGASQVDQTLLARLATRPGPQAMATMVQSALNSPCLAVSGVPSPTALIAGLFSCLPPECRATFSFTTGLKFSSRRPFRIIGLSDDKSEQRWVAHQPAVNVLELTENMAAPSTPVDGWARMIGQVLSSGRTSFLATQLSKRRFDLTLEDLPALGLQLLEDLDASSLRGHRERQQNCQFALDPDDPRTTHRAPPPLPVDCENLARAAAADFDAEPSRAGDPPLAPEPLKHAHAAHDQFEKTAGAATAVKEASPSKTLRPNSKPVLEELERLDDVVFDAISGRTGAMEALEVLWPKVLAELGEEMVAESREQYLRYALSIWEESAEPVEGRNPARAIQALDVLCILFDDA